MTRPPGNKCSVWTEFRLSSDLFSVINKMIMKITRTLLPGIAAAAFFASTGTSAFAWSGGPFKFGPSATRNYDGTYKASVVGRNLIGVLSVQNAASAGSGTAVVFADGIVYTGTASFAVDPARNQIAGVFTGTGSRSAGSDIDGGASSSINGTGLGFYSFTGNSTVSNSGVVNGAFRGTIKAAGGYALIFSGRGVATVDVNSPDYGITRFVNLPIRVKGARTSFPSAAVGSGNPTP